AFLLPFPLGEGRGEGRRGARSLRYLNQPVSSRFGGHLASVALQGVSKVYAGGIEALSAIDLKIADGELFVLLGPSGSGKTTLLRLVAGLEDASSGSIWIGERRVDGLAPAERDVAMVFQNPALYPHLTVFDNLAFGLRARRVARREVNARVA